MNLIIFILLIIGITSVIVSWLKAELKCPPPKIIYRYIAKNPLDIQFGSENLPSQVYNDLFTKNNPWVGGYTLDNGKNSSVNSTVLTPTPS